MTKVEEPIQTTEEHSKVLNRVLSYSFVNQLIQTSVGYYNTAKNTSPLVKSSAESLETTVAESVKWIVPKVQPIVHNPRVEPLLSTVDDFGVRQLERLEKLGETVQTSKKQIMEHPVDSVVNAAVACGNQIQETIVPVDNYLKDSTLFLPVNKALDVAEVIAAKILPEEEKKPQTGAGPITRTARLSKRCQKEVIAKMKGLSMRSPESVSAMAYCVDLIQYAQQNLDSGLKAATGVFEVSKTRAKKIHKDVTEARKAQFKTAKAKIAKTSAEAIHALQSATTVLSQQIPNAEAVTALPHASYETLKQKAKDLRTRKEVAALTEWCQSSAVKLQEVNATLAAYIASHEQIPQQLTKATSLINSILEGFVTLTSTPTAAPETKEAEKVQTPQTTPEQAAIETPQERSVVEDSTSEEQEPEEEEEEEPEEEEEEEEEDEE
mmetsp:Transcript_3109/g.4258  ORF Transcript_3109/g.4258 Transcript_3109/m.4258 type:complete len:437 (-) Transcript_3109:58-1368(-)